MNAFKNTVIRLATAIALAGCTPIASQDDPSDLGIKSTLLIFHNGAGSMCLEALDWLDQAKLIYSNLIVEEHLTTDSDGLALFRQMCAEYDESQGVSTTFAYLPVIFYENQAFSGFNRDVQQRLEELIDPDSQ